MRTILPSGTRWVFCALALAAALVAQAQTEMSRADMAAVRGRQCPGGCLYTLTDHCTTFYTTNLTCHAEQDQTNGLWWCMMWETYDLWFTRWDTCSDAEQGKKQHCTVHADPPVWCGRGKRVMWGKDEPTCATEAWCGYQWEPINAGYNCSDWD